MPYTSQGRVRRIALVSALPMKPFAPRIIIFSAIPVLPRTRAPPASRRNPRRARDPAGPAQARTAGAPQPALPVRDPEGLRAGGGADPGDLGAVADRVPGACCGP